MKDRYSWTYLILLLPPLFWAGNAILASFVADLIPPVTMSFWRWVLVLTILLPFIWRSVLKDWDKIKESWDIVLFLGLLGIASFNTLLYTAAKTTTAINISLTQSIMPVIIVIISLVLFRKRITPKQLVAVILCILGAGYIVIHGQLQRLWDLDFVSGDLIMLLAITLYRLYSVMLRKRPDIHSFSLLTTTFAVGVIVLFPLYLWETRSFPSLVLSQPDVLSLLYVAFFPSIVAYLCWNRGYLH